MTKSPSHKKRKKRVTKRSSSKDSIKRYIFLFLLVVGTAFTIFFTVKKLTVEPNDFESNKYFIKGLDVSHHNPILNWEIVMEQDISFAYLKATEGTSHEDRNYPYNYDLAKKTNIKVGSYHFYSFGLSGKEQAAHFIKIAKCKSGDMLPAIDVEHSPANPYSKDPTYIALVIEELKVLENELYEFYGVHAIIYTNKDCYKLYIKNKFPNNFIWMSDLHKEPSKDINWRIWQFSHKGELPGIVGDIDLNYYRYSFDEFKELLLP
ncbi:glycoside hydrolase family 25 protein [Dysgonomonas sp. ZJ279]|uniref:glycoside hydrolase family 25 protein n=1 Tax=Dysgonomonas sp. ZJ279 TaxID=2709796 RepID=UPI0013EBA832|nr:GH25 family lysozyme [Dysgonomonas sp. ZJ279]